MSTSHPPLTIGMPLFNAQKYLRESLDSILGQSFTDFRIHISDNASTDDTESICQEYAKKDDRIVYERLDENAGAAANFNRVAEACESPFFKWAAYDDLLLPGYLEQCMTFLQDHEDTVLCHGRSHEIDENGERTAMDYPLDRGFDEDLPGIRFAHAISRPHHCITIFGIFRNAALKTTPLIARYVGSDRNLLGELCLYGKIKVIGNDDEVLFYRRSHPEDSVRKHPSAHDRIAWFDPTLAGQPVFQALDSVEAYLAAIKKAPLTDQQRANCTKLLERWCNEGQYHTGKPMKKMLAFENQMRKQWLAKQRGQNGDSPVNKDGNAGVIIAGDSNPYQ